MELQTITMDRNEARQRFLEYRRALREARHDELRAEDEQIMRAYREAAKGAQLIRLNDVLKAGGVQTTEVAETQWNADRRRTERTGRMLVAQLPKLAVARADVTEVFCRGIGMSGSVRFDYDRQWRPDHHTRHRFDVASGTFDVPALAAGRWPQEMVAMAPTIPPALRPKHHLRNYHLLWEAEWKKPSRPAPPVDPALLQHVGGDLYAVLAVWDLTPLERAVLAGTRS